MTITETAREASTRSDTVHQRIRRAILEQALHPGTRLPEDRVGEQFGVSRTIVRTALTRLEAEGLVEIRPNRGAMVASPSVEEAKAVFGVRLWLERAVVTALAGRLTARQADLLRGHVEREEKARGRDGPKSIRLAGEFHVLLAELTGNPLLQRYVGETVSRSSLIIALYGATHSSECAVTEHRQLIDALLNGDAAEAERLMIAHLGAVIDRAALVQPQPEPELEDVLGRYARAG